MFLLRNSALLLYYRIHLDNCSRNCVPTRYNSEVSGFTFPRFHFNCFPFQASVSSIVGEYSGSFGWKELAVTLASLAVHVCLGGTTVASAVYSFLTGYQPPSHEATLGTLKLKTIFGA